MDDSKLFNARMLNYIQLLVSIVALVTQLMGRNRIISSSLSITINWIIFAIAMFFIGYLGYRQKIINPAYEEIDDKATSDLIPDVGLSFLQQLVLEKLLDKFEKEKLYLNSNLNINDVVQKIGTNRTYISLVINQKFNMNFCAFVNFYRIKELEQIYKSDPCIANQLLAEQSGFGSFNSMKRALHMHTGQSLTEWKKNQNVNNSICML